MGEMPPLHPSAATDQQSKALYRRLLSVMKTPLNEDALVKIAIDALFAQFPRYRVGFSKLSADGIVFVQYARQPEGMPSATGKRFCALEGESYIDQLFRLEKVVEKQSRIRWGIAEQSGASSFPIETAARLVIPFAGEDGVINMLSLSSTEPQDWHPSLIELAEEVCELISLMVREARVREKLQNSELLFRQFAENVNVVVWISDVDKKQIVYVNPAYEKIWGRSLASVYKESRSFLDAVHPEDRERVTAAVMRQARGPYEQVYRVVHPNGEVRWVKDRGFQVRNPKGEVYRVVGIAEDITALKMAQEDLEASRATVVSNAKFAALGEMASGIAHEINNPLAVIHGLAVQLQAQFRQDENTPPLVSENLASIEKMANRIAGIVKGLRTFSRRTEGDPMTSSDLGAILQETIAMFEPKARQAGVEVELSLPAEKCTVRCRSSEISQVLLNLLNNAFDAVSLLPKKKIRVGAELRAGRVFVYVEDNGPGVPRDLRERIFQPFFTTKEVGKGTGLGLSISKGLVEAHGGNLSLDLRSPITRFVMDLALERT